MGQTMKLLNNLLSATAMAISSEAVVMGVKAGLDAKQIIEVINAGTGRNSATADKIPRCVIPRKFNTGFAIELLNKDVRLCLEEGGCARRANGCRDCGASVAGDHDGERRTRRGYDGDREAAGEVGRR